MLSKLKENKKIATATHNIYAYRILKDEAGGHPTFYQSCEDDGETHAGGRMLHLLQVKLETVPLQWPSIYTFIFLSFWGFQSISNYAMTEEKFLENQRHV